MWVEQGRDIPLAHGRVLAEEEEGEAAGDQADQGHDKGDAPRLAGAVSPPVNQRVVNSGHDEVSDTTTGIAPASGEGIGGADNVLVEPAGAPHLAWHKGPAEDADEEPDDVEPRGILDQWGEANGDASDQQDHAKHLARSKLVTERSSQEPNSQGGHERDNV